MTALKTKKPSQSDVEEELSEEETYDADQEGDSNSEDGADGDESNEGAPDSGEEAPDSDEEAPDSDEEDPGSDEEDPGSDEEALSSDDEAPGSDYEALGSDEEDPGSDEEDPGSDEEDPSSDEELLSQDPGSEDEEEPQGKEEAALRNIMGSLLSKNKTDKEILSKASKNIDGLMGEKKKRKSKPLEIVQEDGTIIKVKEQETDTTSTRDLIQLPKKRKLDLLFSDACLKTDLVKEKKLRSLATRGVVQLFNTLEQHRQQQRAPGHQPHKKSKAPVTEMTAITSGNSGLIDFLATKTMGGDRQLFSELKDEEEEGGQR